VRLWGGHWKTRQPAARSSVKAAQAEGQRWSKGAGGGGSGEKRAGATHAEEMGRRVSGVAHAREIETGPEGSRAVPRENRILNLDHRKCIEQLSFVAQVATVTTIDEESNEEKIFRVTWPRWPLA
jgi:hypothetical protein